MMTTMDLTAVERELERIESLPIEERPAALEELEQRLRALLEADEPRG